MRVVATTEGLKYLQILSALQGIKEGAINAYYSGTIRRHETALNKSDLMRFIETFFAMSVEKYPSFVSVIDEDELVDNAEVCFSEMAAAGLIRYMAQTSLYVLDGLYTNSFYLATESNIQANGVLVWGKEGYGATCDSYLHPAIPFDDGVTLDMWLSQFPNHGVAGNDVVLSIAAADAVRPLITGWSPHLNVMVTDFRSFLPVVVV